MAAGDDPHVVALDAIESLLIRFYPVEKLMRTTVYISWPLIPLNLVIAGVFLLVFLAQIFSGGSLDLSPNSPALTLGVVYLGLFAMVALNVLISWFVSNANGSGLALAAAAQFVGAVVYTVNNFVATARMDPSYYSPLHLLTVSPVYLVYFLVTMAVSAWFLYSFVIGVYAVIRIPRERRLIARPEYFQSRFDLRTLERYGGLPPVVDLLPRRPLLKLLFYFSSFCFVIATVAIVQISGSYFVQDAELRGLCASASDLDDCLRNNALNSQILVVIVGLVAVAAAPRTANALLTRMHKLSILKLAEMQRIDPRPPVLFLRAFRDDQVPLREPRRLLLNRLIDFGRPQTNLDQLVLDLGTPYGPVAALGNPTDQYPPYGAARGYFDGKTWKQSVEQLGRDSVAVVLCLDDTEGVWWEVNHLVERKLLHKTLILIHPKDSSFQANSAIVGQLVDSLSELAPPRTRESMAELKTAAAGNPPVIGLFFNEDGSTSLARSSTFSRLAYTLSVRWFLRERLGREPAAARGAAAGRTGAASATGLAVVWLIAGMAVAIAMGFVFSSLGLNALPAIHPVEDGKMLTGWTFGTALYVAGGVALVRLRGWSRATTAFSIVWLGSTFMVGVLMWPLLGILKVASDGVSFLVGLAFFVANVVAFFMRARN